MRRTLTLVVALVAGCGDDLQPGDRDLAVPEGEFGAEDIAPRLLPEVCGVRQWTTVAADSKDMDLAVVPMALAPAGSQGAAVFGVAKTGGTVRSFLVDARGLIMGDPAGNLIQGDATFTGVSAGVTDGILVAGLLNDAGKVSITAVSDDLTIYRELGVVDGDLIGDMPLMSARGVRIAATAGAGGVLKSTFDYGWAPIGTEVIGRSLATSMTGAAYGDDALVIWSTESTCHLSRLASGLGAMLNGACHHPRLATDFARNEGALAYEAGNTLMFTNIFVSGGNELSATRELTVGAASPRVVFDGTRYWVSYIDYEKANLVVGFVDERGKLIATALEGTEPRADAYDLVMMNGSVWVFAVDTNGYGAQRLCLAPG